MEKVKRKVTNISDLENLSKEKLIELFLRKEKECNKAQDKICELETKLKKANAELIKLVDDLNARKQANRNILLNLEKKSEKNPVKNKALSPKEKQTNKGKKYNTLSNFVLNNLKEIVKITVIDPDFEKLNIKKDELKPFGHDDLLKLNLRFIDFDFELIQKNKYKDRDKIYTGEYIDPFPRSILTPETAAALASIRVLLGTPYYALEHVFENYNLPITSSDLATFLIKTADVVEPMYEYFKKAIIDKNINTARVIHHDETPMKILEINKKGYFFVSRTSLYNTQIVIFDARKSRSATFLLKDEDGFDGYNVIDGYVGYYMFEKRNDKNKKFKQADLQAYLEEDEYVDLNLDEDEKNIVKEQLESKTHKCLNQCCFWHLRRYVKRACDSISQSCEKTKSKSVQYKIFNLMSKLANQEETFKKKGLSPKEIYDERNNKEYLDLCEKIHDLINSIESSSKSLLHSIFVYYNHFQYGDSKSFKDNGFFTYLKDGHIDLGNNSSEREMKTIALIRKRIEFCKSFEGAKALAILASIISTANYNGLNEEKYMAYLIKNVKVKPLEELAPRSDNIPHEIKIVRKK